MANNSILIQTKMDFEIKRMCRGLFIQEDKSSKMDTHISFWMVVFIHLREDSRNFDED